MQHQKGIRGIDVKFDEAEMKRLAESEETQEKIAAYLAEKNGRTVSRVTVSRILTRLGIKRMKRGPRRGEKHCMWKGGRRKVRGYVMVYAPDHWTCLRTNAHKNAKAKKPKNVRRAYVPEHRLVMEKLLGRPLLDREVVHHKNHIRDDNRPENLELFPSHSEHMKAKHEETGRIARRNMAAIRLARKEQDASQQPQMIHRLSA